MGNAMIFLKFSFVCKSDLPGITIPPPPVPAQGKSQTSQSPGQFQPISPKTTTNGSYISGEHKEGLFWFYRAAIIIVIV